VGSFVFGVSAKEREIDTPKLVVNFVRLLLNLLQQDQGLLNSFEPQRTVGEEITQEDLG
jgi:hypothetical protein